VSDSDGPRLRLATPAGRYVLFAAALGSGIAFLDSTVVNVALPAIGRDFDADLRALQWVLDGYLVTLTAFLLLGGSLGDMFGRRRIFVYGLIAFTIASVLCGLAPNAGALIVARALQGTSAALLVPGSLSIISASFASEDRGRAVGMWSGLTGVTSAIGPFLGGWLVDAVSWRLIFFINVPLAAIAVWLSVNHVPETKSHAKRHIDITGAMTASIALGGLSYALIEAEGTALVWAAAVLGVAALVAFFVIETRKRDPMLPLDLFRIPQFSGANATTLAVYAALGGAFFLIVLELQTVLGYSAIEAGASLVPITALMLLLSPRFGALSERIGPRLPMTIGPVVVGVGLALFSRVGPGDHYLTAVLPATIVFGFGLSVTVAPLTAAVLGAVENERAGIASGVNNAVARLAGLLAVAVLPGLVGLDNAVGKEEFSDAFSKAMYVSAIIAAVGGLVAWLTVRDGRSIKPTVTAGVMQSCHDPSRAEALEAAS
jgi:EmrB/QacA subfamily drug resistance transporter